MRYLHFYPTLSGVEQSLLPSVLYWYLHSEENSEAELIGFLLAVAGLDGALHRQDSPVLNVLFKKKNNW